MEPPGQVTLSLWERYKGQSHINKRFVERVSEECIDQPQGEWWQEREAARSLEREAKLGWDAQQPGFAQLPHSHHQKGLMLPRAKVKVTAEVLGAIIRESRVGHRNAGRMNGFGG